MAILSKSFGLLLLALLGQVATALPDRRSAAPQITTAPECKSHSCFSYTETVPYTGPIFCPVMTKVCGPTPECIILEEKTIDVPCADPKCPVTPTVTVTGPGKCFTCQTGCATDVITRTLTTGCTTTATPL